MWEWMNTIIGTGGMLLGAGVVLYGWARREVARVITGLLCVAIAIGFRADVFGALNDAVAGSLTGAPDTPTPASTSSAPGNGNKFNTFLLYGGLGLGAAAVTAVLASVFTRRRRRAADARERAAAEETRRRAIEAEHDEVREAYGRFVTDVLAFLDRPALDDVTVPATAAFLHALDAAADTRRGSDLTTYREAVSTLKTAWRAADTHATKTGVGHLPPDERAVVNRARLLLERALADGGSEHERHAAYAKARQLLDDVHLSIPRQAAAALEVRHRLPLALAKAKEA